MESIKRTVKVTRTSLITVELLPKMFMGMSEQEYLDEFSKGLFEMKSIDDLVMFAASVASDGGYEIDQEGLGRLVPDYRSDKNDANVIFDVVEEDIETEFVEFVDFNREASHEHLGTPAD